ncbi:unnamed protein product [Acanthoscelides obtectus]|uniref:Protein krueppel n=1 Tax=Acanthoscelides obtectus TaxID=200917 RepID=A0A9P0M412_ACAOB|nr:unnamed protein product [Acanthoscelides obtectus]CAK1636105.1 Zinc finger protein 287 [Acanthoscelides obtectus]
MKTEKLDMDMRDELDDFHATLEPMVIINDGDISITECDSDKNEHDLFTHIEPDISITPVEPSRDSIKLRSFRKDFSHKGNGTIKPFLCNAQTRTRPRREQVRRISKDEASSTEDTYAKRRSNPLELCPVCKKYFRRMKTHLMQHKVISRTPGNSLSCSVCEKVFNSHSNLVIHMRSHTGDKPYVCEVCNKSFTQSCNLVNHMRIHTGEKPFKCPHCDRAFTQSGNLTNHIRLHTDEKPFKCHFCDKAFVQSGNLNSHMRNNHKIEVARKSGLEIIEIPSL